MRECVYQGSSECVSGEKKIVCNICKYKGHFGRQCKSKGRKPAVNTVDETVNSQNCSYSPEYLKQEAERTFAEQSTRGPKRG